MANPLSVCLIRVKPATIRDSLPSLGAFSLRWATKTTCFPSCKVGPQNGGSQHGQPYQWTGHVISPFLSRTLSDSTSLHFHCMPRQPVDRNEHVIFRLSWRKKKVKNPEKLKTALTYSPLCPIPAVGLKYVKCLGAFAAERWRKKNENFCSADVAIRQFSTTAPSAPNTSGFRSCFF